MRLSRFTIALAMGGGTLCMSPLAAAEPSLELLPTTAPSRAAAPFDPRETQEPVVAPLPPAIVVGPATLAFAAWVRYRIRRRGDRI